jgi:hypothetical protein
MYPPATSLIPVQIALARFWETNPGGIWGNYPFWYLGSTPFRYLTGPILPFLLVTLHRFFPAQTLFNLFWPVLITAFLIGGLATFLLFNQLKDEESESNKVAILAGIFYLTLPLIPILFRYGDGLYLISFSFLPLVLFFYARFLKEPTKIRGIITVITTTGLILLNITILPQLILGMAAVILSISGWKRLETKVKRSLLIVSVSMALATVWYTPGFWWQLLAAPSFGGKSLISVIGQLFKIIPLVLAVVLASFGRKALKTKSKQAKLAFYWLVIFLILTGMRFLADPKYWLDWSAYAAEVQFGIAAVLAIYLVKMKPVVRWGVLIFSVILFAFIFKFSVRDSLQKDLSDSFEYQMSREVVEVAGSKPVFLSGSTVFWLNAFFDVPQLRGGRDPVAVLPNWDKIAWEVRTGEEGATGVKALKKVGVNFVVVHDEKSRDFFHDIVYSEKFDRVLGATLIYKQNGDMIYRIE